MLQFVHVDGANGGKDLQTRRKVRSQAMRDFRRRQRAEKEAVKGSHRSLSVPNEGSSPAPAARDRATSTDSGLSDLSTRRSPRSSQKRASTRPAQKDGESTFKVQPNLAIAHDLATIDLVDEWQNAIDGTSAQSLGPPYWTSSFTNDFPPSGSFEPIITTEEIGIEQNLDSLTQMSQALELCQSCGHSAAGSWCRDGVCDCCAWLKLEPGPMPGMPGQIPPNLDWLP